MIRDKDINEISEKIDNSGDQMKFESKLTPQNNMIHRYHD